MLDYRMCATDVYIISIDSLSAQASEDRHAEVLKRLGPALKGPENVMKRNRSCYPTLNVDGDWGVIGFALWIDNDTLPYDFELVAWSLPDNILERFPQSRSVRYTEADTRISGYLRNKRDWQALTIQEGNNRGAQ